MIEITSIIKFNNGNYLCVKPFSAFKPFYINKRQIKLDGKIIYAIKGVMSEKYKDSTLFILVPNYGKMDQQSEKDNQAGFTT